MINVTVWTIFEMRMHEAGCYLRG